MTMENTCERCGKTVYFDKSPEYDVCMICDARICTECGVPHNDGGSSCKVHIGEDFVVEKIKKPELMDTKKAIDILYKLVQEYSQCDEFSYGTYLHGLEAIEFLRTNQKGDWDEC